MAKGQYCPYIHLINCLSLISIFRCLLSVFFFHDQCQMTLQILLEIKEIFKSSQKSCCVRNNSLTSFSTSDITRYLTLYFVFLISEVEIQVEIVEVEEVVEAKELHSSSVCVCVCIHTLQAFLKCTGRINTHTNRFLQAIFAANTVEMFPDPLVFLIPLAPAALVKD